MKFLPVFCLCISFSSISYAQDTIDVVEKTIKVGSLSKITEYYGFAEGDKLIFNLEVENRKDIKDVTISEYPHSVKFADHSVGKMPNKVLNVSRRGIYVFEYYNSNISGRTVKIKIQRIPKSISTKDFNTNIKWVTKVDTVYAAKENTYLINSDTSVINVMDSRVRVNSITNSNGNKTSIDFTIPANTIKWTYWIGVGNEGQAAFRDDQLKFSKMGADILGSMNPLVGLCFGMFTMTHANLGENVKYYFLPTPDDVQKFYSGQTFMQFKNGNIITDFGLLNYATKGNEKYFIGFENDNAIQGIDVNVKIIAIVVNNKYSTITEKVPNYVNKSIPEFEE